MCRPISCFWPNSNATSVPAADTLQTPQGASPFHAADRASPPKSFHFCSLPKIMRSTHTVDFLAESRDRTRMARKNYKKYPNMRQYNSGHAWFLGNLHFKIQFKSPADANFLLPFMYVVGLLSPPPSPLTSALKSARRPASPLLIITPPSVSPPALAMITADHPAHPTPPHFSAAEVV